MKNKIIYRLAYLSLIIIDYVLWGSFLLIVILSFWDIEVNKLMHSFFFIMLGIWLGYRLCLKVTDYLKKYPDLWEELKK